MKTDFGDKEMDFDIKIAENKELLNEVKQIKREKLEVNENLFKQKIEILLNEKEKVCRKIKNFRTNIK